MAQAIATFARILARHWPMLLAWFFIGECIHETFMQLSAYAGAYSSLAGILILPLAVLGRLVGYVAMFLIVRDALPAVRSADAPERTWLARAQRFAGALVPSILPFLAFYTAWGLLEEDRVEFARLALAWYVENELGSDDFSLTDRIGTFVLGPLPIAVLVIALAVRLISSRLESRLPVWTMPVTVYAETLWAFLLVTLVAQQVVVVTEWVHERAVTHWVISLGDWFSHWIPPIAAAWDLVGGIIELFGAALLLPVAWLTVAGIVYGAQARTIAALENVEGRGFNAMLRRFARRLGDRFSELWNAVTFVLAAGPLPAGLFVVAFTLWSALDRALAMVALRSWGAHENDFWVAWGNLLQLAASAISVPLMIALVAAAYDAILGQNRPAVSEAEVKAQDVRGEGLADLEREGTSGVLGDEEHRMNVVPARLAAVTTGRRRRRR